MSRPNTDQSRVVPSDGGYGSFVVCPSCSRQSDIWMDRCACGYELLPDDRKVKLAKSGASATGRMIRRCDHLQALDTVVAREQAVRDLAALRAIVETEDKGDDPYTSRIVSNLIKLDRLDEACEEAESLPISGRRAAQSLFAIEAVARELDSRHDDRAEVWLRRALEMRANGREHLELQTSLVRLFSAAGRQSEALDGLELATAELEALRKKSSKSTVAILSGSGETFATSYWSTASNALDALRKPVVEAGAATAAADGHAALAEAQRFEGFGDLAAARDTADAAARRVSLSVKRLKPLVAGLSRSEAKEILAPVEEVVRTLEAEHKRLKKLAKRS